MTEIQILTDYMNAERREATRVFRKALRHSTADLRGLRRIRVLRRLSTYLGRDLGDHAWLHGYSVVLEDEPETYRVDGETGVIIPAAPGPRVDLQEFDYGSKLGVAGILTARFRPTFEQAACFFAAEAERLEQENAALRAWWGFRLAEWTAHLGRRIVSAVKRLYPPLVPRRRHEEEDKC